MLQALINSQEIAVKSGTKNGNPWEMREQGALVTFPNGEVKLYGLLLERNEAPLVSGVYEPKPSAFVPGKYAVEVSLRARDWKARTPAPKA